MSMVCETEKGKSMTEQQKQLDELVTRALQEKRDMKVWRCTCHYVMDASYYLRFNGGVCPRCERPLSSFTEEML